MCLKPPRRPDVNKPSRKQKSVRVWIEAAVLAFVVYIIAVFAAIRRLKH